jgi:ribose transport system permease protein
VNVIANVARPRRLPRPEVLAPTLAPIVLVVVFGLLNDRFLSPVNLQNIGQDGSILLVLAFGLTYVILMGAIDLSVGALLGLGEVVTATLVSHIGYAAFVVAVIAGLAAGLVNGLVHVRTRIPSFIATLGLSGIWLTAALAVTRGENISVPQGDWHYLEWVQATQLGIPATVFLAAAVLVFGLILERRTPFGRYMYAIGAGEEAARASGVSIGAYKTLAFGLSGAAATGAGALFSARLLGGSPIAGDRFLLLAIAVVVVGGTALTGGTGGILRTLLGALVMTLMVNGMSILGVDPNVQQVLTGLIVIGAVLATMDRSRLFVTK